MRVLKYLSSCVGVLLLGTAGLNAQSSHGLSDTQLASLLVAVADVHSENGRGPVDSCSVLRAIGVAPSVLVARDSGLVGAFDELERPCGTPRHHGTLYNRLTLQAVDSVGGAIRVQYGSQIDDRVATWELLLRESDGAWVRESAEETSALFIHGGTNSVGPDAYRRIAEFLASEVSADFRVDPRIGIFAPRQDSVWLVESGQEWSRSSGLTWEVGDLLARLSCVDPAEVGNHGMTRTLHGRVPCSDRPGVDLLFGGFRASPPNLWTQHVWAVSDEWVRVLEVTLSYTGDPKSVSVLVDIPRGPLRLPS